MKYFDMKKEICELYGSPIEYLNIGGQETWNFDKDVPTTCYTPVENPLPTDCRYREDLIWLRKENYEYSEDWKSRLE